MRFNAWVTFNREERLLLNDGFYLGSFYLESMPLSDAIRESHGAMIRGFTPNAYKGQFTAKMIHDGLMMLYRIEEAVDQEAVFLASYKVAPKLEATEGRVLLISDPAKAAEVVTEVRARQRAHIEGARQLLKAAEKKITSLESVAEVMSDAVEDYGMGD